MRANGLMQHHLHSNAVMSRHPSPTRCISGVDVPEGVRVVTAVQLPSKPAAAADVPAGRTPRRVRPPRWLDLRLVLGVLLVLGSVLLGARVVGAADATVPVWAVTGDLAAGTRLDASDLRAVD